MCLVYLVGISLLTFWAKISFQRRCGRDFHSDMFLGNFFNDFLGDNFGSKICW